MKPPNVNNCQIYLISPPRFELNSFKDDLSRALETETVSCFQLRLKEATDTEIFKVSASLLTVCQSHGIPLIINDRPDIAADVGAEGAHIGADDTSYEEARELLGDTAIVGISCYDSRHMALIGAEAGADYVAFGAFFPTTTKMPKSKAEPELLSWWQKTTTVPCVAIGGITINNCQTVINAGADFIAVISGVWDHPDGSAAVLKQFDKLCRS